MINSNQCLVTIFDKATVSICFSLRPALEYISVFGVSVFGKFLFFAFFKNIFFHFTTSIISIKTNIMPIQCINGFN